MRIGIDFRIHKTGIGRYTQNLLRELAKIDDENEYVVFLQKDGYQDWQPPNERFTKALANHTPYSFAEQILFCWQLWRQNLNLVHFTNFNVPLFYPGRYVVTIHDLIHMSHSTFGSSTRNYLYYLFKKLIYQLVIRWTAWRAERVLVPSRATRDDVIEYLKVVPKKVVVTYEGFDRTVHSSDTNNLIKLPEVDRYLLYVATMYPHKNHRKLIEAFKFLLEDFPKLRLTLVGKVDYFSKKLRRWVKQEGLADKILFPNFNFKDGYVPDGVLGYLYTNAAVYVFPSLKEGFGIPILEAQAHKVPVVAADIPSLQEIGRDSVKYFDPEDAREMAGVIKQVLDDNKLALKLVSKGSKNIKRFDWHTMAQQTHEVYKFVLKN